MPKPQSGRRAPRAHSPLGVVWHTTALTCGNIGGALAHSNLCAGSSSRTVSTRVEATAARRSAR